MKLLIAALLVSSSAFASDTLTNREELLIRQTAYTVMYGDYGLQEATPTYMEKYEVVSVQRPIARARFEYVNPLGNPNVRIRCSFSFDLRTERRVQDSTNCR
jgi:hypothetical protein